MYGGLKTQVERSKYKVSRLQTPDLEYLPLLPLVVGRLLLLRPVGVELVLGLLLLLLLLLEFQFSGHYSSHGGVCKPGLQSLDLVITILVERSFVSY